MSRFQGPPEIHTVLIHDPHSVWEKLAWDVWIFEELQRSRTDKQRLSYAAINVCVAASALQDWASNHFKRTKGRDDKAFDTALAERVPHQAACRAIANTFKHSASNPKKWSGGSVHLELFEPDEDDPGGWIMYHLEDDGIKSVLALTRFSELRGQWWHFLSFIGAVSGTEPLPEWQQQELRRIFGDR